jgi:hypothetical protein
MWGTVYSGNGLSAKVLGLKPQTLYRFRLRAIHDDGPTNWSALTSATTTRWGSIFFLLCLFFRSFHFLSSIFFDNDDHNTFQGSR